MENRSHSSNLLLVALQEKVEGNEHFGAENLPTPVRTERAHHIPASSAGSSGTQATSNQRPMIAKFLNFKYKVWVISAAGKKNKVMYNNQQVFFSDSTDMQCQRKAYYIVKQTLHSKGIQYGLLYPAKLHVKYGGKVIIFQMPKDVDKILHTIDTETASD